MDILKKRWIYIINGFIVLLFMGCSLAWSIFVVPLETAFSWTRDQTSLAFTINILCFSVGSVLAGILSKNLSFSALLKIAAIMMCCGFLGTSFVSSVWQLYMTYGIIVGTGIGMGYNCVISACPLWLPEKTATATGMLLMGYALSTAIFGPVLNKLIESIGIIYTFRTLAVVCGVGIFLGSFMLKSPSVKEIEMLPHVERNQGKKSYNVITSEMVKMPIFWIYYLITALFGGIGLVIINHCSPILVEGLAANAGFAAMVVSIISISNGISRLLWGIVFDKIGVKKSLLLIACCFTIACLGMYFSFILHTTLLFVVCACLLLFSFGGNAITCPSIIRELFGHRTFSLNYSVVSTGSIINSLFPSIAGMVQVATKGYTSPLLLLVAVSAFTLLIVILFSRLYHQQYELKQNV